MTERGKDRFAFQDDGSNSDSSAQSSAVLLDRVNTLFQSIGKTPADSSPNLRTLTKTDGRGGYSLPVSTGSCPNSPSFRDLPEHSTAAIGKKGIFYNTI